MATGGMGDVPLMAWALLIMGVIGLGLGLFNHPGITVLGGNNSSNITTVEEPPESGNETMSGNETTSGNETATGNETAETEESDEQALIAPPDHRAYASAS